MKKIILFLTIYISPAFLWAQEWQTVHIDSSVSVKLPGGFEQSGKDDKYNLVAVSPWGTILIFKTPDNPAVTPDIEKDRHLQNYYDDYIKNVRTVSTGSIVKDEKDGMLGELKVKDFTLQIDTGSGVLYRSFRLLHANSATYIFEFLYQDLHSQFAVPEKELFFNSISLNENMNKSDQYTSSDVSDHNKAGLTYLYWAVPAGIIILIFIIYALRRKRLS
jgi:hypothetical protein